MALVYQLFWGPHLHHGMFVPGTVNPRAAQGRLLDFCAERLALRSGFRRVLDVGCGHGGTMFYLASRFGYNVDGQLLVAAWTGSMTKPAVRCVAEHFLCPSLLTAEEYGDLLTRAGLHIETTSDLTARVAGTWDVCLARARKFRPLLYLFSREVRSFVTALPVIQNAYESGDLSYTVMTARKQN